MQWHTHTLKLESYLKGKPASVAGVTGEDTEVAAVHTLQDQVMEVLQSIVERIGCLEAIAVSPGVTKKLDRQQMGKPRRPIVCHKCWQEGHFARGCAASCRLGLLGN